MCCEDCAEYRELVENNFHEESEKVAGECGSCEDFTEDEEDAVMVIQRAWKEYRVKNLLKKFGNCGRYSEEEEYAAGVIQWEWKVYRMKKLLEKI